MQQQPFSHSVAFNNTIVGGHREMRECFTHKLYMLFVATNSSPTNISCYFIFSRSAWAPTTLVVDLQLQLQSTACVFEWKWRSILSMIMMMMCIMTGCITTYTSFVHLLQRWIPLWIPHPIITAKHSAYAGYYY